MNPTAHNSHRGHRPRSFTSPEGQQTPTCLSIGSPSTRIDFTFICEEQAVVLTADNLADAETGCCWSQCSQARAEGAGSGAHPSSPSQVTLSEAMQPTPAAPALTETKCRQPKEQGQQLSLLSPTLNACLPSPPLSTL